MEPAPIEIKLDRAAEEVTVVWDDEHQSVYPLWYLRGYCPCAQCQGHAAASWTFVDTDPKPEVMSIEEVGQYAINFVFKGGHRTGLYSYEALRRLCPCKPCLAEQGDVHPMRRLTDIPKRS